MTLLQRISTIFREYGILFVILLAACVRFSFLGTAPSSFSVDEASNGYDAYSILETMRDRYGNYLPLFFRALDDSREGLFLYFLVPFIKFLGLNEFATRLPAAIIGTLTVFVIYELSKELFHKNIATITALLFAISPWHIFFSRLSFRVILLPLLFCLALLMFLKSLRRPYYLPLSAFIFSLSIHTYPSARAFVPLFLLGLVVFYRQHLLRHKIPTLLAISIFLPIFYFLFRIWISPEGMARVNETGIEPDEFKIFLYYLSYFDPVYLFLSGDPNPRRSISTPGIGELYLFELFTVFLGLCFLQQEKVKNRQILFLWLLLYPIPAALIEPYHAIRSLVGAPLFSLLSGYGLYRFIEVTREPRKKTLTIGATVAIALSFMLFLQGYFIHYSKYTISRVSKNWQYGMREAIAFTESHPAQCVIVSDRFWRPNLYILFYGKYPPEIYQNSPIDPALETNYSVGKYYVTSFTEQVPKPINVTCLFMIKPDEVDSINQQGFVWQEVKAITDPGGEEAIKILEVQG